MTVGRRAPAGAGHGPPILAPITSKHTRSLVGQEHQQTDISVLPGNSSCPPPGPRGTCPRPENDVCRSTCAVRVRGPAPGAGLGVGSVRHAWTGAGTLSRCFGKNEGGKEEDFLGGRASRARSNRGVCVPCTSSVATNPFPPVGCCGLASSGLSPEWPRACSGPSRRSGPSCLVEEVTMSHGAVLPGPRRCCTGASNILSLWGWLSFKGKCKLLFQARDKLPFSTYYFACAPLFLSISRDPGKLAALKFMFLKMAQELVNVLRPIRCHLFPPRGGSQSSCLLWPPRRPR